ncbi:hypothetical protein PYW08_011592 [Mythimna loreyi]|uniref:Uncharacterized protein n=1 Tax=Mythimna loreyi TaxID=667449 RepID=A0ACC2QKB7_9NEOP|nr:hypothetical protein PYW08_011592 [Mythimna loreyi]
MKSESPVFTRCCHCFPLRHGLIAWGYLKIVIDILYLWLISNSLVDMFNMVIPHDKRQFQSDLVISTVGITIFFTDFVVTIMFIVGGHKKNLQLIRLFFFLSIGMWIFTFLLTDAVIVLATHELIANKNSNADTIVLVVSVYCGILATQTYFLMLLRSEIMKLKKNNEFRFENKVTEVKCTIKCEDITKEELGKCHI